MITELGLFCVILAFIVTIVAILFKDMSIRSLGAIMLLIITAQASLFWGFYIKDLSIKIITLNTNYLAHISANLLLAITLIVLILWIIRNKINVDLIRIGCLIMASSMGILLIEYNPFLRASISMIESI